MRQLLLSVILLGSLNLAATAQQPPIPRFEVASIKLWQPPATRPTSVAVVSAPSGSGIFNRSTSVAGAGLSTEWWRGLGANGTI
jgi:hypothetical protein